MDLALIAPACFQNLIPVSNQRYQMVIPEGIWYSPEYELYYDHMSKHRPTGKYFMLDNGAFESYSMSPDQLLNTALKYRVTEIVAPDTPGDMYDSLDKLESFLTLLESLPGPLRRFKIMAAVQGNTLLECKNFINHVVRKQTAGGVDTLGFPKHLARTTNHLSARIHLVKWAQKEYPDLFEYHALGYNWPGETQALAELDIRSMDTDAPFVGAFHGYFLEVQEEVIKRPDKYWSRSNEEFDKSILNKNFKDLDKWAKGFPR